MSYILNALDKSEQARQNKRTPNLKTAHASAYEEQGNKLGWWIGLTILTVSGSILLLTSGYNPFNSPQQQTATETVHLADVTPQPRQDPPPSRDNQTTGTLDDYQPVTPVVPKQNADFPEISDLASATRVNPEVTITPESTTATTATIIEKPPSVDELPLSIQRQIPDLTFSTHIYADEVSWRMVGINGKSRRQGDTITGDLVLLEITEEGVVLGLSGTRFTMSVIRDWSAQ